MLDILLLNPKDPGWGSSKEIQTTLLKKAKQQQPLKRSLVITESLFSMEGTTAPIKEISILCTKYNSKLLIEPV